MNILELLQVDACLCITSFKEERFQNMIQLRKELGIHIEFIEPIRDSNPSLSYSKTFVETIRKYKGRYKKVLMLEDDCYTDLLISEIESHLILTGIPSLDYDILCLGSQPYIKTAVNPYLYKIDAFGYMHAVCFNLELLNEEFILSVEKFSVIDGMNIDCGISGSLHYVNNAYSLKESIFLQKNFISGINSNSRNCKLDFRYTRDQSLCTNTNVKIERSLSQAFDYLNNFGDFQCYDITFSFTSMPEDGEFNMVLSDYNTGIYLWIYPKVNNGSWVMIKCPPSDRMVIEMERASDGKIIHREVFDLNNIHLHDFTIN
jgi:hypothetical protein